MFAAVVEAGSLHSAARKLGVTQPALTQTIKTLEKAASTQLMHRSREGVELTPSGKLFYESALRILKEASSLGMQLNANLYERRQRLRIGIFESIAIYAWPRVQEQLRNSLRLVGEGTEAQEFELHTGRTEHLLRRLNVGELDIAIAVDPSILLTQKSEILFEDKFYLYCSSTDQGIKDIESKARGKKTTTGRPLFLFESARVNLDVDLHASFAASQIGERFVFETLNRVDSFEVAVEFVRAGLGFALLPEHVAARNPKGLYRLRPEGKAQIPIASHYICAVAPHSVALSTPFQLLCDAFRAF